MSGFVDWFNSNSLVDMGYVGQNFTWVNKRGFEEDIWVRLDGAVCSRDWRIRYGDGYVKHLPRVNSDHCPIILYTKSAHITESTLKPFRFEAMWSKHKNYDEFIKKAWPSEGSISEKLDNMTNKLKLWNKDCFGNLFHSKRRILARLQGVQRGLSGGFNGGLAKLENVLVDEYNKILDSEETFWAQKSRDMWLKNGDRNTSFFHTSNIVRRRHNKI
ncbi:hypothetical protein ACOSQ4_022702 [Xanthoceras sorbifolium]